MYVKIVNNFATYIYDMYVVTGGVMKHKFATSQIIIVYIIFSGQL